MKTERHWKRVLNCLGLKSTETKVPDLISNFSPFLSACRNYTCQLGKTRKKPKPTWVFPFHSLLTSFSPSPSSSPLLTSDAFLFCLSIRDAAAGSTSNWAFLLRTIAFFSFHPVGVAFFFFNRCHRNGRTRGGSRKILRQKRGRQKSDDSEIYWRGDFWNHFQVKGVIQYAIKLSFAS